MKHLLVTALALLSLSAQAKTMCTVSTLKDGSADVEILKIDNFEKSAMFVISKDNRSATPFVLEERSLEAWNKINGQTIVAISRTDTHNALGLFIGRIDMSKKQNMLPETALAIGIPSGDVPLAVMAPGRGIGVSCFLIPELKGN